MVHIRYPSHATNNIHFSSAQYACLVNISNTNNRTMFDVCACSPACNEILYSTSISQAVWPSKASLLQVASK